MSKLNINRNIFLEREELLRWQKFMLESPVNKVFLSNTTAWGIIDTSGGTDSDDFKVEVGSTSGTVKIATLSRALQTDGLLIEQSVIDNIAIPEDSDYYWLKIGHEYTKYEEGTVSITADGQITGLSTAFTDVLRGQGTEVPVKIKLDSDNNTGIYEVVDVLTDTSAILQGDTFTVETGIPYFVIGSTPLGDTVTSLQEGGLYFYDSCLITQVAETVSETEPAGKVDDEEFWIARVVNNSGTVTIEDKRTEYWEYYIKGVSDKLDKNNNLSDVVSPEAARSNIGVVYSKEDIDTLLNINEIDWTSMERGGACVSTGFDIKISRIGKNLYISGTFQTELNPSAGTIIASIALSKLGDDVKLNNKIYEQITTVDSSDENRGIKFYVKEITEDSDDLQIIVGDTANDNPVCYFNMTIPLI